MTVVENLTPRVQYNYIAEQQQYPITFPYIERQYVKCMVGNELLVYNTDYQIPAFDQESLDDNELYLTLLVTPTAGDIITIYRDTPIDQQTEFPQEARFSSQKITEALDKLTQLSQEQADDITQCLRLAKNLPESFNTMLPFPEANQVIQWNEDGTQLINYDLRGEIAEFEEEVEDTIDEFKDDVNEAIEDFKTEVAEDISEISTEVETANTTAQAAESKADTAVETANSASSTADEAKTIANTALTNASTALSTANTASTNASTALSTANTASTNASTALSTANTALSTAQSASTTANSASNKVDEFGETIQTVLDAAEELEELESAVNTAVNAAEAANAAIEETMEIIDNLGQVDWEEDDTTSREYIKNKPNLVLTVNNEQPDEYGNVNVQTGGTQVQADWNETDTDDKAYIKNKPTNLSDFTDNLGSNPTHTHSQYLTSHQNLKTINGNSIVGTGNLIVNGLPSQTGQSGKYLTTDGTDASWSEVDSLPSQTSHSGDVLTTDGSDASWSDLSSLGAVQTSDLTNVICKLNEITSGGFKLVTYSDGTKELICDDYTQSTAGAYTISYPSNTFTSAPFLQVDYHLAATASTSTTVRNYGYERTKNGFTVYLAANAHISFYARGK